MIPRVFHTLKHYSNKSWNTILEVTLHHMAMKLKPNHSHTICPRNRHTTTQNLCNWSNSDFWNTICTGKLSPIF